MNPHPNDQPGLESPMGHASEQGAPGPGETEPNEETPRAAPPHPPIPESVPTPAMPARRDFLPAHYQGAGAVGKTMYEGLFLALAALWLSVLLTSCHLFWLMASQENAQDLTDIGKVSPFLLVALAAGLAPCIEEPLFRGLPCLLLRLVGRTRDPERLRSHWLYWPIGALAALVFAIAHGAGAHSLHVPLPQLMLGLWSWQVINTRGLRYSILLHGTYNFLPTCLMALPHR